MPLAVYKKLGLGEPTLTNIRLVIAYRSIKRSVDILLNVLVMVVDFILPADFVVLDCEVDFEVPIILGKPFLATGRVIVDMELNELKFKFNDKEARFKIHSSMRPAKEMSLEMAPKGKNSKNTKKMTKESVPRRLFNEESNYKEKEPLLRKQKKKQKAKKTPPPSLVEAEESEKSDNEPTTYEHTTSYQMVFEQQETNRRAVKRIIFEKKRIITKGLSRYPEVEQKFHGYDLGCTTGGGNSFCPTLVREFYKNYRALLENMCREGEKIAHQPLLDKVSVWGVMVDVFEETINRAANVPKIVGLEKELFARKTHNLIQNKENQPRLMLDRDAEIPSDPAVTGTSSSPNAEVSNFEAIPPISAIIIESSMPRTEIISSTVVPITEFAFNPMNFMRVAKQSKWCEAQLKIFAKKFTTIVEKRVKAALDPYKALPSWIDELENHFNV
ncbi:putative AP3-complex subunit beta-A-like [Capsicum annuum]|nr:putative AP3-complex subunit beta-A-like [Capsicum annuum]